MDKLRALQYFVTAAEVHSFTAAARRLEVSVPAIAKLITALERQLGTSLFDRGAQGIALTADGQAYLESCRPLLEQLAAADEAVGEASSRPHGTLVIGAPAFLAQHCILPALPRFHARYPDIRIDIRFVDPTVHADAGAIDVFVVLGWPKQADLVHRQVGQMRLLACAAPSYWAAHGIPQHPRDLKGHECLLFRNRAGTVLDLWQFQRGGETESVAVAGWLVSDHRDVLLDTAIAGEGVARLSDLTVRAHLQRGQLVPALLDWELQDSPPINLLYRPNHRRIARVRLFIDFVTTLFSQLESERDSGLAARLPTLPPQWHQQRYAHGSAAARTRR
jgi:DNA-binding transcriptional LysR family regulator